MSKLYRIPDYKKLYPDASEEVIAVLKTTERKMQYQEYDLKREQTIVSQKDHTVTAIPSREDSYERLLEQQMQFREDTESVEEIVLRRLQYVQLHKAISRLSADEQKLIQCLYFQGQTEREVAINMGIYHNAVHKRKNRILEKLKNILEKN